MSSIAFDTHEFVKRLRDSGFAEKTDITDLRRDMAEMKCDLLKWVVGVALAQIGLLVGILLKLPH